MNIIMRKITLAVAVLMLALCAYFSCGIIFSNATSSASGGIFVGQGGNITLDGGLVSDNDRAVILHSGEHVLENVTISGSNNGAVSIHSGAVVTIRNCVIENSELDTKDAFWHAKNVTVRNSVVKGEYLAWYCENVTFENCTLIGTQPLCYCKNLRLINCKMIDCDLSFEKSSVDAEVTGHIDSVKNPECGRIIADSIGEIIYDGENIPCEIKITSKTE
jgi:hypothetical protein